MTPPDESGSVSLTVSRIVPAPPEAVFRAWTEPGEIEKWWAPEGMSVPFVEIDLRVGGTYRLGLQRPDADPFHATGTYREVQPPRRLVFTWRWGPDMMKAGETRHVDMIWPLWNLFDLTPEGRGWDWQPRLEYRDADLNAGVQIEAPLTP